MANHLTPEELSKELGIDRQEVIRVYRAPDPDVPVTVFRRREIADAEPALPGWRMPVDELFD